jgi:predicted HNH restriction endonuclease
MELICFENSMEIHHIMPLAEGDSNQKSNMALIHRNCHENWHYKYSIQVQDTRKKLTKNRQRFQE